MSLSESSWDPDAPELRALLGPWWGTEKRLRCGRCDLILATVGPADGKAVIITIKASGPHVLREDGEIGPRRPHIRSEMTSLPWESKRWCVTHFCNCGAEHHVNEVKLVRKYVQACEDGRDLILED